MSIKEMTTFLEQAVGSSVFTIADALAGGASQRRLALAVRRGDLLRLRAGVSRMAGTSPDSRFDYLDRLEEVLHRHPSAALAGVSAAAWDLPCPDIWGDWGALHHTLWSPLQINSRPDLVRLMGGRGRACATVADRPATDLVTTAVDVAWQLPGPEALIVIDAVARRLAGTNVRTALGSPKLRERIRARLVAPLAQQPRRPHCVPIVRWLSRADPAAGAPPESYAPGQSWRWASRHRR